MWYSYSEIVGGKISDVELRYILKTYELMSA
jgi:hypothetical protein